MQTLRIWREGARAQIRGGAFAMTPYPTPHPTELGRDNAAWKRAAWAAGWWWSAKHRPYRQAA
jgi:hypothetical protein